MGEIKSYEATNPRTPLSSTKYDWKDLKDLTAQQLLDKAQHLDTSKKYKRQAVINGTPFNYNPKNPSTDTVGKITGDKVPSTIWVIPLKTPNASINKNQGPVENITVSGISI